MQLLVIVIISVVALLALSRFVGRGQDKVLGEYKTLEKRFGLTRRTTRSKWGKGINERYTLEGKYRGYPILLYSHYQEKSKPRIEWTTLAMELLFTEEIVVDFVFNNTTQEAKFPKKESMQTFRAGEGIEFLANQPDADSLLNPALRDRLARFANNETCGAIRLSKGFLEYRESGLLTTATQRIRYQEALLLLADLADALSVYMVEQKS